MHTIYIHLSYISGSFSICTLPFFCFEVYTILGFEAIEATAFAWVWSVCDQPISAVGISCNSSKKAWIWHSKTKRKPAAQTKGLLQEDWTDSCRLKTKALEVSQARQRSMSLLGCVRTMNFTMYVVLRVLTSAVKSCLNASSNVHLARRSSEHLNVNCNNSRLLTSQSKVLFFFKRHQLHELLWFPFALQFPVVAYEFPQI